MSLIGAHKAVQKKKKRHTDQRKAVKTHPKMTDENAWGYIASLLGISPMSPSGVVLPSIVPLLIAEEDAGAK